MTTWVFVYGCRHCRRFRSPDKYAAAAHQRDCRVGKARFN